MSVKCTTCDKSCSFRKEPFSPDYTALLARHNALIEAVRWERECDVCGHWLHLEFWANDDKGVDLEEIADIEAFARAEVDRLIGEYST